MRERLVVAPEPADLEGLESLWAGELSLAYEHFVAMTEPRVALAAAMVDTAARIQRLGGPAASPADLLLGDLCLARASRLLADVGDLRLQVAFARAVESSAAAAAGGQQPQPMREQLAEAIRTGG